MPRTPLRMPKLSMTMESGDLSTWLVAAGDQVSAGQPICEVMTDKVEMEVEAPSAGTIAELLVEEGATVAVGDPMAWIETDAVSLVDDLFPAEPTVEPTPEPTPERAPEPEPKQAPEPAAAQAMARVRALPAARRMAAEASLDLGLLRGSGPAGALLVSDVVAAVQTLPPALAEAPATGPAAATAPAPAASPAPPDDETWADRLRDLAPRREPPSALAATVWRDAVLPRPPIDGELQTALAVAVSAALAELGPEHLRERPRVGLVVATGTATAAVSTTATVTVTAVHLLPAARADALVRSAIAQAAAGWVDVRFTVPPDVTVTWLPDVVRVLVPPPSGALAGFAVGTAADAVIASGAGMGIRPVVTVSASAEPGRFDPAALGRLLARVCTTLEQHARSSWLPDAEEFSAIS